MKTYALLAGTFLGALSLSPARAAEHPLNGHTFTLPDGFVIEQVAGPPLVDRPIVADLDEQGRLYVADSSGSNEPVKKQLDSKPHRIVRLEDTNGDGTYDRSIVFADRMMFPEGAMWLDGSLYVSAPPSIWKLTDTDQDGTADLREEWFEGKTLTGCANDLHGPYRGRDGWIYWCKGAFARQEHLQADGSMFSSKAAHIFRRHPKGGPVEPVMTGGMDNPVDVVFTPEGERLFTTTFFQHPGGGRRDGLIHAIYGGVYGKPHDVLNGHPRTGDLMPVLTHLGPAAPCGLALYESDVFGAPFQYNLFACNFNLHKLTRHILQPNGSTFQTVDSDFLISDQVDFHPTDVIEDRDGSLIVVDTGGWYKICCPTSQLYKPDVLGAIYRIRKANAARRLIPVLPADARSEADRRTWIQLLAHDQPAVAERAVIALAAQGAPVVSMLAEVFGVRPETPALVRQQQKAVWTLTRIEHPGARAAVRRALGVSADNVIIPAAHSTALWRDRDALDPLLHVLESSSPPARRAAAEALGRIGSAEAVPALLDAMRHVPRGGTDPAASRVLEHSLVYALIQIGDRDQTVTGLRSKDARIQKGALVALDQMPAGNLEPGQAVALLSSRDESLRASALWILHRHPEWAPALAAYFADQLSRPDLSAAEQTSLPGLMGSFASDARIQEILANALTDAGLPESNRRVALAAMASARLTKTPPSWNLALAVSLTSGGADWHDLVAKSARDLPAPESPAPELESALLSLAGSEAASPDTRLNALAGLPEKKLSLPAATFQFLTGQLQPSNDALRRQRAATILIQARLTHGQQMQLARMLRVIGPLELSPLLGAFTGEKDEVLGREILRSLEQSPARQGVREEILTPALKDFPPSIQAQGRQFLLTLQRGAEEQKERLDNLLGMLEKGDVRRGQEVFNSSRTACSTCHAIGYLGGTLGPDLTRIGQIRTERDLLEAIVYPSISFVRSYESILVQTRSNEQFSGILRQDTADEVVLATGPETEIRIPRGDIAEIRPGTVSVMPGGLDEQLTHQELADLVAFLKATQW